MTEATARDTLATFGHHGQRVRVLVAGGLVRVQWYDHGLRRVKSWPDSRQNRTVAKEWARAYAEKRLRGPEGPASQRLTLDTLWNLYTQAEFPHLRERTRALYAERWGKWLAFMGRTAVAEDTTQEQVDAFRAAMAKRGTAVNQVRAVLTVAKVVYGWGERRELLTRNRLASYRFKVGKDQKVNAPDEYRLEEWAALLATFNPQSSRQWRPWALLMLLGNQGVRERAALHLAWEDVDLDGRVLTWRKDWDKMGREWTQPMRLGTYAALLTAKSWRERDGYTGPWVFYTSWDRKRRGSKPGVYGAQAFAYHLWKAEAAAGVEHRPFRGAHGFRKMVAGEVAEATGDPWLALQFIGDTDVSLVQKYLKRREDRLVAVANQLDGVEV